MDDASFWTFLSNHRPYFARLSEYRRYLRFQHNQISDSLNITMINCKASEAVQVELGQQGFPRGFPVVWSSLDSREIVNVSGFYPKRSNDDKTHQFPSDLIRIEFTRKFSGFLTGAVLYRDPEDDVPRFWVVSKQSAEASTPYNEAAQPLWKRLLTRDRLDAFS